MNQYALSGKGTSILSSLQMEWYNIVVNDKSMKVGRRQQLKTVDRFIIPLNIYHGLPYLDMCPYTDEEWKELPHVHITCEEDWDPSILDHEQSVNQDWYEQQPSTPLLFPMFDEHRELHHHIEAHTSRVIHNDGETMVKGECHDNTIFVDARSELIEDDDVTIEDVVESMDHCVYQANIHCLIHNVDATIFDGDSLIHGPKCTSPSKQDYEALKPCFALLPMEIIKKTFSETTQ
jgi:hypothetical protein